MRAPGDSNLPEQRSDATTATAAAEWSIERAAQYYNVAGWGAGFFSVNDKGHMVVHPMGQPGPTIDLMDVVEDIQERKHRLPVPGPLPGRPAGAGEAAQRGLRAGRGRA